MNSNLLKIKSTVNVDGVQYMVSSIFIQAHTYILANT